MSLEQLELPAQTISFDDRYSERIRDELVSQYVGSHLRMVCTPTMIIDRSIFA